jgi:hypothetical protein
MSSSSSSTDYLATRLNSFPEVTQTLQEKGDIRTKIKESNFIVTPEKNIIPDIKEINNEKSIDLIPKDQMIDTSLLETQKW